MLVLELIQYPELDLEVLAHHTLVMLAHRRSFLVELVVVLHDLYSSRLAAGTDLKEMAE